MNSNFLAFDRYLRRYSEKNLKKVQRAAPILQVTYRKSLHSSVLKTQGWYSAWKKLTIDTGFLCRHFFSEML